MMQTLAITGWVMDFNQAKALADANANILLHGEAVLLSWYDQERDFESPAHASECHLDCDIPGYIEYAVNRGAKLKIDIAQGTFVFCYLSLDEFCQ